MSCKRLDDDSVRRWKADTAAAYTRLIVLDDKAMDNGLTDLERAEHKRLSDSTRRRLAQLLAENRVT